MTEDAVGNNDATLVGGTAVGANAFFLHYSGRDQRFAMSFTGLRALSRRPSRTRVSGTT